MGALCVLPTKKPLHPAFTYFDYGGIASVDIRPPRNFPTLTFELHERGSDGAYSPVISNEVVLHLQILVDET